jgi:alkanesulfonate monooxygenase SsuD/methylene tetrahydromethanopterin reductase-like flavin-dependent oxidoreductase (luciferase family)
MRVDLSPYRSATEALDIRDGSRAISTPVTGSRPLEGPALNIWTDVRPDLGERDGRRRYAELLDEVRLADTLPFRAFCTTEQHGVDDGYLPAQLTLIAGLATMTKRIRFMTSAVILPLHPLRTIVEQAIVADLLSKGRVALGLAAGGFRREFELFGVDMSKRGQLMEKGIPLIRQGLTEGQIPDGPDASTLPVLPLPTQPRLPIYLGGLAAPVIDRAVRLADGVLPYDFIRPDESFPRFWRETLKPALDRHGRSLDEFRFNFHTSLWAAEDPERDFEVFVRPAMEYQQGKYAEWAGAQLEPGYATLDDLRERSNLLVDTPDNLARRILAMREDCPFHELTFWYRIPGISHEQALAHLELVAGKLIPLLRSEQDPTPSQGPRGV